MGGKYEVRIYVDVKVNEKGCQSFYFNKWWDYMKFRIKNNKQLIYIKVYY